MTVDAVREAVSTAHADYLDAVASRALFLSDLESPIDIASETALIEAAFNTTPCPISCLHDVHPDENGYVLQRLREMRRANRKRANT